MAPGTRSSRQPGADYDVAIIGYGPVGATLAGLLGRYGLCVGVFEKSTDIYAQPRAVGFDHDAMRIFQRIGIAADLASHIAPFRDAEYFGVGGRLIQRVRHMPPPYPLTWAPNYTCDQPGVEAVLRAAVARQDSIKVALGHELLRLAEDGEHVRLELQDDSGDTIRCTADYVVACDGAASPVRRMLGIELEDFQYDEPWIVVDVLVNDEHLARLPSTNVQYCQPERPSTFITCPGNHRRWEFMTLPGEPDAGQVSEERLWRLLARWLKPGQARIWRAAAYRFHALVAHRWRLGRVLLASDSAHQTPPFLGQGMCQGLRDAGNLAWKLEQVVRGLAPPALLDSYTAERRPHVLETTRLAKAFGCIISERDPVLARERDVRMLGPEPGNPKTLLRQELIPALGAGLIATDAPLAGKVLPQPMAALPGAAPILFDDLTAPCWRLVISGAVSGQALDIMVAVAARHRMQVIVVNSTSGPDGDTLLRVTERDGLLLRWLVAAGCVGALVRPDHYVFGGFDSAAGAATLLDLRAASPYVCSASALSWRR